METMMEDFILWLGGVCVGAGITMLLYGRRRP
jgi:hypothetical protein